MAEARFVPLPDWRELPEDEMARRRRHRARHRKKPLDAVATFLP